MHRTPKFAPLTLAAALAAAACGPSELEVRLGTVESELAASKAAADVAASNLRATEEALLAARAEANSFRAIADRAAADATAAAAAGAKIAEAEAEAKRAEKRIERLEAHRDEMREWIEKDLLPLAEQQSPELVNLRDATEEMAKQVAAIRGLEWKEPVMRRRIRRAQMGEWMQRDLRKELPEEKATEMVLVGAEMGLIPEKTDLYNMFSEFMEAGVAAFYRPDTRTFYHIEGNDGRGAYPVVFHELVHAIEDQHFDLEALSRSVEDDSDAALAQKGLVEGSASLFQDLYQEKHPGDVAAMMKSQMTPDMMQRQQRMMQRVPPFLVAMMALYPYNNGKVWVRRMTGGDPAKVAALFADPPASTEQVLHPEKYEDASNRDYPHRVTAPDLAAALPGWKSLDPDNMGELGTGCLLAQLKYPGALGLLNIVDMSTQGFGLKEPTKSAVAGWDGDRSSAAIDPATGRATICWVSVWDSVADAEEFVAAYAPLLGKKVTRAKVDALPDPIRFAERDTGRVSALVREGNRVIAVLGAPADRVDAVLAAGMAAKVAADPRDKNDSAAK